MRNLHAIIELDCVANKITVPVDAKVKRKCGQVKTQHNLCSWEWQLAQKLALPKNGL